MEYTEFEKKLLALKALPDCELKVTALNANFFKHQKTGVNYLLNLDAAMLADQLGLGKSLQSLGVSLLRKQKGEIKKCLIICPATTKYVVWKREIEKFTDEKCLVVDGPSKKRTEIYTTFLDREDIFYLIMNYEQLLKDTPYLLRFPRNLLCIADESIYIKTRDSKRTKELKKIPFKYKICVTGYPAANKILDIWSQFDWLKPGFLGSYWSFFDRYVETITIKLHETEESKKSSKGRKCTKCNKWSPEQKYAKIYTCCCINPEWEAPSFKKVVGYKNLDELKHKLEPYFIRRLKSEALDLPEKTYEEREVLLSGDLLKAYIAMKEEMKVIIKSMSNEEIIAKANGVLTQMLRLSQLTCGFITDIKLNQPMFYKENPKVKALDDIIDEVISSGNKIVIWTRFRAFTAYIYKRYSEGFKYDGADIRYDCAYFWGGMSAEEKDTNINRFQTDPNCKIIIGTVQTGGMGITLHAGNVAVFTDLSFLSPSTVIQAEARQHRIGQTKNVVIIRLLAKNTVDSHWMKVLEDKQAASRALFREDTTVEEDQTSIALDKDTLLDMLGD